MFWVERDRPEGQPVRMIADGIIIKKEYTAATLLCCADARAIVCVYEEDAEKKPATRATFKTFDASIQVGDLVIVPTGTRHGMTVVRVVEVDYKVDYENLSERIRWIVQKVDAWDYHNLLRADIVAQTEIAKLEEPDSTWKILALGIYGATFLKAYESVTVPFTKLQRSGHVRRHAAQSRVTAPCGAITHDNSDAGEPEGRETEVSGEGNPGKEISSCG